ncbi:unnamed protein product [Blepharisma stoltei]|uniref:Uncharacterized protein n=1 Tax=Blepharisma stoltei TaxID=1481888 RepID=A0AAU9ID93_9CILI|nr:unnamed protein product [Blepharisma stoltei]
MFLFLILFSFAISQELHEEIRKQKIASCLLLLRYKTSQNEKEIQDFVNELDEKVRDTAMNKIIGDIMINCIERISVPDAVNIFEYQENVDYLIQKQGILVWNKEDYRGKEEISYTEEYYKLFEEIKQVKEQFKLEQRKVAEPLPLKKFGWRYFILIVGIFGAFFYWAVKRVLKADAPKKKKNKKDE